MQYLHKFCSHDMLRILPPGVACFTTPQNENEKKNDVIVFEPAPPKIHARLTHTCVIQIKCIDSAEDNQCANRAKIFHIGNTHNYYNYFATYFSQKHASSRHKGTMLGISYQNFEISTVTHVQPKKDDSPKVVTSLKLKNVLRKIKECAFKNERSVLSETQGNTPILFTWTAMSSF